MFTEAEARPPYVTFEIRAVEDRAASIEAGQYVSKDIAYAIITPQGSKDRIERIADEWFQHLAEQVQQGRFKMEWLRTFKDNYALWKEGQEVPESGTSVRNWPAASPAQVDAMLRVHLRTIEDVASANEEAIGRLGMGGRMLQQKAREWLSASSNVGRVAEEATALKVRNEELEKSNKEMREQLAALSARLEALEGGKSKKL